MRKTGAIAGTVLLTLLCPVGVGKTWAQPHPVTIENYGFSPQRVHYGDEETLTFRLQNNTPLPMGFGLWAEVTYSPWPYRIEIPVLETDTLPMPFLLLPDAYLDISVGFPVQGIMPLGRYRMTMYVGLDTTHVWDTDSDHFDVVLIEGQSQPGGASLERAREYFQSQVFGFLGVRSRASIDRAREMN